MADSIVQIILKARDEASKVLQSAGTQLQRTQAQTNQTSRAMQSTLSLGANLGKAALLGLGGAALLLGGQLLGLERDLDEAASGIAGISGQTSAAIPAIRAALSDLKVANGETTENVKEALKQVYTAFKIFDPKDPKGIAQLLLDWKDVSGQRFDEAGKSFRSIVLTYFGPQADLQKALQDIAPKIYAVATAVGIDPGGLANALAEGGETYKTVFGDMDKALAFLGKIGGAGGDIEGAGRAVRGFLEKVQGIRDNYVAGKEQDEGIVKMFKALGISIEEAQNKAVPMGDLLTKALTNAGRDGKLTTDEIKALGELLGGRFAESAAKASSAFPELTDKINDAMDNAAARFEEAGIAADDNLNTKMSKAWQAFLEVIAPEKFRGAFTDGLKIVFDGLAANDWGILLKGVAQVFSAAGTQLFKTLLGADPADVADAAIWWWDEVATPGLAGLPGNVSKFFAGIWKGISSAVGDAWKVSSTFWAGIAGDVWSYIKTGFKTAIDGASGVAAWAANTASSIVDGLGKWLAPIGKWASDIWTTISSSVTSAISDTATGVSKWAINRWKDLEAGFNTWIVPIGLWAVGLWTNLRDGATKAFNDGSTGISSWALNRWTSFRAELGKWWTGITEVGGNLMAGLIKGMGDAWNTVVEKVRAIGGDLLKTFNSVFGIKSPSTEMAAIGGFLLEGLTTGLKAAFPEVAKAVEEMSAMVLGFWNDGKPKWDDFGKFVSTSIKKWGADLKGFSKIGVDAFASFASFLGGEAANGFQDFGAHLKDFLNQMITGLEIQLGTQAAVGIGTAIAQAPLTFGVSLLAIPGIIAGVAAQVAVLEGARAIINSFDVGSPYVERDQLAQIHKGEIIVPRSMADGIRSGDMSLGSGAQTPVTVQVWLDGRMVAEQVGKRLYDGTRALVRADLRPVVG